ncbi:DNA-binding protein [Polychaeton citri CBS 116435]|uniref:DNA-binding protein n=1 Tax=Polychaeton citri CBS 116435 TaxID=1314669 RepID=A0A9P4UTA6_9PEZI|nr:DNA-binding protein [Polychaeton citri CBS 116435]
MSDDRPTFRLFVAAFADFFTCAVHTVLYERSIYPQSTFLSTRKYNFAVRQSRHPKVCEWIHDAVTAVEEEILNGAVEKVSIVIFDKHDRPMERFVFDVSRFPDVPSNELDTPIEQMDGGGRKLAVLPVVDMEEQFRAAMSRLTNCSTSLDPIPGGCIFTIAVDLKETGEAPLGHPQPWIPLGPGSYPLTAEDGKPTNNVFVSARPLRTVDAGRMKFESWIEETCFKSSDKVVPDRT